MKEQPRSAHRAAAPIKSLAHRFVYSGLVIGVFALMLLGKADAVLMDRFRAQISDAIAPILGVLGQPVDAISGVIASVRELSSVRQENALLREDKEKLLRWQAVARQLEAENKSLKKLLRYVPDLGAGYVTARVIADTGGAFAQSLLLNAGAGDGVGKGEAVVTGAGLIGRIAVVGNRSARVLLITDLNSRIPVIVEPTRTRAILAGNNSERPGIIHLPPGATVSPGDRIVTSGHGGAFPPGLPVGVVASVSDSGIRVQPYVDRSRLEYVRVVNYGLRGILRKSLPGGDGGKRGDKKP